MALRYSFGLGEWADKLDQAIAAVLAKGIRTRDIAGSGEATAMIAGTPIAWSSGVAMAEPPLPSRPPRNPMPTPRTAATAMVTAAPSGRASPQLSAFTRRSSSGDIASDP